jgi:hypothetical protein
MSHYRAQCPAELLTARNDRVVTRLPPNRQIARPFGGCPRRHFHRRPRALHRPGNSFTGKWLHVAARIPHRQYSMPTQILPMTSQLRDAVIVEPLHIGRYASLARFENALD